MIVVHGATGDDQLTPRESTPGGACGSSCRSCQCFVRSENTLNVGVPECRLCLVHLALGFFLASSVVRSTGDLGANVWIKKRIRY